MVPLLIEDITIRKGEQVRLDVRFRGGASKTLMLPRPLSFCESHKQDPAMVAEMDRLLEGYNYADTARASPRSEECTGTTNDRRDARRRARATRLSPRPLKWLPLS